MGRKPSSRTQQTSKSEFTHKKVIISELMGVASHKWMNLSFCFGRKDHEKAEFEVHEVYAVDVLISTGEGKVR